MTPLLSIKKMINLLLVGLAVAVALALVLLLIYKSLNTGLKGPSSSKIQKQIYYDEKSKRYYRFVPEYYVCPPSISAIIDDIEHSDDSADDF